MKIIITILLILCIPAWALPMSTSIVVMQANDGKILHSQNATLPMAPASTTKLLTTYAALQKLGHGFTFKTQVLKQGNDLYIRFVGDPSLKREDLNALLIQALNNQEIKGNLLIDASAFAEPWVAKGWSVEDTPWYFAAPIHGVILDENSFSLTLTPPKQVGEKVTITSNDPSLKLVTQVKAVSPETADNLCQLDVTLPSLHQIQLKGCWPANTPPQTLKVANVFPLESAQATIISLLKSQGITLQGKIGTGATPKSAQILAEHESAPLSELIKPILQDSNNIYAESLTKTLGGVIYGRSTFQAGSYYIQNSLINELGLIPGEILISDGSGLSTQNLVSANALAQLLRHVYQESTLRNEFIGALSASGSSGTLKTRLATLNPPFVGKTGGMSHVATLAGYHGLEGDNPLIYVIMINHGALKASELRQSLDKTLQGLINSYFTNTSLPDKLKVSTYQNQDW